MQQQSYTGAPQQTDPYSVLAELYDHLMVHVDYKAWADYVLLLCHIHNHIPKKILELACGTGNITFELVQSGLSVTAADRSPEMLKQAQKKLFRKQVSGNRCRFIRSDMTHPPVYSGFNTILCIYDSINYLTSLQDIQKTVQLIVSKLCSGGVFIFDMCTEYNSVRNFNNNSASDSYNSYSYIRNSRYIQGKRKQLTEFTITSTINGSVWNECHEQYIYPIQDIRNILEEILPGQVRMFKDYTFDPAEERCERVHIFIKKP